jgi:hypothetical protein
VSGMAKTAITTTRDVVMLVAYRLTGDDQECADIFGVGRTAVVNWRKRHGIASAKPRDG